tara:strand:+ start:226 stop:414 length:189 start_codon:yes stop_codon:yes gene_type:complete
MTDKETIERLALQVEQLSEDVRGLTYTVQDLVTVIENERAKTQIDLIKKVIEKKIELSQDFT